MTVGRRSDPGEYNGPGNAWVDRPMPCADHQLPPELLKERQRRSAKIRARFGPNRRKVK